jgi:tetratricopeptide (TPR) repeat protein
VAAQAYINLQVLDTAVRHMKIAAAYTRKTEEKGRYYYILGQLYNRLQYPDSADMAFDKVIEFNRKIPRVYLINAKLQKIANRELTEANSTEVREYLTDLEQDRENRPFLDKIYRSFGVYYQKIGAQGAALDYYNKSLRATRDEPYLNSLNYTDLAEYYFDQNNFKNAGAYYDSVLLNVPENSRTYRSVSKKRQNLDDVIAYESVVQQADSILALSAMSPLEREIYFQSHIDSIRAVAEAESVKKQEQARTGLEAFSQSQGGRENQGSFYFYNITSLGYGKNEFRMRWGDRELEDNWRWSTKSVVLTEATDAGADLADGGEESLPDSEKYSLDYYLARIPEDPVVLDSLRKERNFANYQLGLIYKEKFGEPMLAAARLEAVLDSDPEERLILPSKYNLYKIYQEVGSPLQESMKQDIVENHPDSRYASILANPNVALTSLQNVQEVRYAALYRAYEDQEYLEVITGAEAAIDQFTGEPVVPKLELLKANAIGRLQGFSQFREALNYIALNYPNTPEGQKARAIVEDQIPKLESTEFTDASTARATANWKLVFPFNRTRSQEAQELKKRLEKSMEELGYRYTVSRDIYDLETEFVVVHGFASESYALGYAELLRNNRKYRISNENFVILSDNYKVVQVHKNLADYRAQVQTPKS